MKIDYPVYHKRLILTVAQWYLDAWGKYTRNPSIEKAKAQLINRLNTDKLDIYFLCLDNGYSNEPIGTFSLTQKGIPENEGFPHVCLTCL
jgi:hypothetical protein